MRNLEPARSPSHMRFSTFSSSDSMTRHGVNLVLSIGTCELAPGAPRLQGARPLGNRGMSLLGTKRTCRGRLMMSAPEGKTGVPHEPRTFPFLDPERTSAQTNRTTFSKLVPRSRCVPIGGRVLACFDPRWPDLNFARA